MVGVLRKDSILLALHEQGNTKEKCDSGHKTWQRGFYHGFTTLRLTCGRNNLGLRVKRSEVNSSCTRHESHYRNLRNFTQLCSFVKRREIFCVFSAATFYQECCGKILPTKNSTYLILRKAVLKVSILHNPRKSQVF